MATLDALRHALFAFLAEHQYGGLFLLLLVEEAGVPLPLPGDKVVMWLGIRARGGEADALLVILLASAAVTLGSSLLYWVARRGGRPLVQRYGRYCGLRPARLRAVEERYRRWGAWGLVVGRLVPGVRIPTCVLAGVLGVPFRVFFPCTALAAVIWAGGYFLAGLLLERPLRQALLLYQRHLGLSIGLTVAVVGVALAVGVAVRRARQRRGAALAPTAHP